MSQPNISSLRRASAASFAILTIAMFAAVSQAQQPAVWRLVEEWRVGGAISGPHSFTKVVALRPLPDGRIVVVEGKDQQIHILGTRGEPLKTIGRRGGGPGEFQEALGALVAPNGEIVIQDIANARLTFLSSAGEFLRTVPHRHWGATDTWDAYYDSQRRLTEHYADQRRVWNTDYTRADTTTHAPCTNIPVATTDDMYYRVYRGRGYSGMSYPFVIARRGSVNSPDGTRWIGEAPEYRQVRRVPFGSCTLSATASLAGPAVPIPTALYDEMRAMMRRSAEGQTGSQAPDPDKIRLALPAFESLTVDASNRLWVERLTPARVTFDTLTLWPIGPRRFDVFAPSGTQVATLDVPDRFRTPRVYGVVAITADRLYGFVLDGDDIPYLTAYRVVRN